MNYAIRFDGSMYAKGSTSSQIYHPTGMSIAAWFRQTGSLLGTYGLVAGKKELMDDK